MKKTQKNIDVLNDKNVGMVGHGEQKEVKNSETTKVSPQELYRMANGDTEKYTQLMRAHGYVMRKDNISLDKIIDIICIQRHGQKDEPGQRKAYTPLAQAILEIL